MAGPSFKRSPAIFFYHLQLLRPLNREHCRDIVLAAEGFFDFFFVSVQPSKLRELVGVLAVVNRNLVALVENQVAGASRNLLVIRGNRPRKISRVPLLIFSIKASAEELLSRLMEKNLSPTLT